MLNAKYYYTGKEANKRGNKETEEFEHSQQLGKNYIKIQ